MGLYDIVKVPCPTCGTTSEFQTKSGACNMEVYELDDCPPDVITDVNRHAPNTCQKCKTKYGVRFKIVVLQAKSIVWPGQETEGDES
jgi:hypothetical protein